MMYNKVMFFDFDGTIMDSPKPETGEIIYKNKTGNNYPHKGWWSKPESLDIDIFDILPNYKVLDFYNININNPNCLMCLLTNRIGKMKPFVKKVLDKNNIYFDKHLFKYNNSKIDRIQNILNDNNYIKSIDVFDDDDKEIENFINFSKSINIEMNIYHIIDGVPYKK